MSSLRSVWSASLGCFCEFKALDRVNNGTSSRLNTCRPSRGKMHPGSFRFSSALCTLAIPVLRSFGQKFLTMVAKGKRYNRLVVGLCLMAFVITAAHAQQAANSVTYRLVEGIGYRSAQSGDAYAAERCVLDVYYPENTENFPTVVWF